MSLTSLFERIIQKQKVLVEDRYTDYRSLVIAIADGHEPPADRLSRILTESGQTIDQAAWLDVINVPGRSSRRIRIRFADFAHESHRPLVVLRSSRFATPIVLTARSRSSFAMLPSALRALRPRH